MADFQDSNNNAGMIGYGMAQQQAGFNSLLEQHIIERHEKIRDTAKAADTFFKANPEALNAAGFSSFEQYGNQSALDRGQTMAGVIQGQAYRKGAADVLLQQQHANYWQQFAAQRQDEVEGEKAESRVMAKYAENRSEDSETGAPAMSPMAAFHSAMQDEPTGSRYYFRLAQGVQNLEKLNPNAKQGPLQTFATRSGAEYMIGPDGKPVFTEKPGEQMQMLDRYRKIQDSLSAIGNDPGSAPLRKSLESEKDLIENHFLKGNEELRVGPDGTVSLVRGGKGSGSSATPAFTTKAQEKEVTYTNGVHLMDIIAQGLTAGHVGVNGVVGEYLVDRGLAQYFPKLQSDQRTEMRSMIQELRESLMGSLNKDSGRFSQVDRDEIAKALPSTGIFESLPHALKAIQTARDILVDRSRTYAEKTGTLPPPFAMTPTEIQKAYQGGADALKRGLRESDDEFKRNYLTYRQAHDAIARFYPQAAAGMK